MKLLAMLLLLAFISPLNYEIDVVGNNVYENACRYNIQGWIYVHIEGDAYERGYQHGYLLYAEIVDMIYRWSNIIHNCPLLIKRVDINSTEYEELSKSWWETCKSMAMKIFWPYYPEEYKEEIRGIADGVKARGGKIYGKDVSYEDILTLNEMYELMSILTNPQKSMHFIRDIVNSLSKIFPFLHGKEYELSSSFIPTHHCNGFAAVGNATIDGNIVISDSVWCGGWWYTYYIAQRWNIILDIEPSRGHRILMASAPGYIWSDHDYYQNDAGLAMIETTFIQGIYKLRGLPLAVRARMAMQYGNSIDDIIYYLLNENTGVMNSQWLIADAKEKEIALLEFGLYEYNVIRKKNGFLWSANNPISFRVRREILRFESLKAPIFRLAHILLNATGYQYYTFLYTPAERDIKFEELGKKYYGKIDSEVVKKIMSTPPITEYTTDCKITDGSLIFNNSLWVFWGNMHRIWNKSHLQRLKGVKDVPPAGWVKIVGVDYDFKPNYKKGNSGKGKEGRIIWQKKIADMNYEYAKIYGNDVITACYENTIYVFDENGKFLWSKELDGEINDVEIDDKIYVVTENSSYSFSLEGRSIWKGRGGNDIELMKGKIYIGSREGIFEKNKIFSFPVNYMECRDKIYVASGKNIFCIDGNKIKWKFAANGTIEKIGIDDNIYFGSLDGNFYCIDRRGKIKWKLNLGWGIKAKPVIDDNIYFGSLDGNFYCIDRRGKIKWIFSTNASIQGDACVYGDFAFFGSDDGRIYAVNKTNGKIAFSFCPSYEIKGLYNYITTPMLSNVYASNGKLYFSSNGMIYCIDAMTIEKEKKEKEKEKSYMAAFVLFLLIAILLYLIYHVIKK